MGPYGPVTCCPKWVTIKRPACLAGTPLPSAQGGPPAMSRRRGYDQRKRMPSGALLDWQKEFNKQVNKIRYVIEQVIANFKGCR